MSLLPPVTVPLAAFSGPSEGAHGVAPVAGRPRARLTSPPTAGPTVTVSKSAAALNTRTPLRPDASVASVTPIFGVTMSSTYTLIDEPTAVTRRRWVAPTFTASGAAPEGVHEVPARPRTTRPAGEMPA